MTKKPKRAALYVRVSTDEQSIEHQIAELRQVAERRGWSVVEVYRDAGISDEEEYAHARRLLATGMGILKVAREVGIGTGTAHRLRREMAGR